MEERGDSSEFRRQKRSRVLDRRWYRLKGGVFAAGLVRRGNIVHEERARYQKESPSGEVGDYQRRPCKHSCEADMESSAVGERGRGTCVRGEWKMDELTTSAW